MRWFTVVIVLVVAASAALLAGTTRPEVVAERAPVPLVAGAPAVRLLVGQSATLPPPAAPGATAEVERFAPYVSVAGDRVTARYPGAAVVVRGEERFAVEVVAVETVPLVKVADLAKDPAAHTGKVLRIAGTNRGWSAPAGKTVAGQQVTRSDFIVEDDTGALYVTGASWREPGSLTLIGGVTAGPEGFAFAAALVIADRVVLDPEAETVLRPGQKAWLPLDFSKSTWSEFKVEGEAVKVVSAEHGEDALLEAAAEGEAVIRVWTRFWHDPGVGEADPNRDAPSAVYRLRVVKP